ncbi:excinuclease ABC subunit C [Cereibacter changlensis JA139]|uniref:Excinuclease ABC subunit C n=2 Tax=Cereibacter changlensis TaxID=402884 RepID=A0A2T4JNW2_9RHOB|nr:GIY-YIG nuclease family protein [Cereibacter changlensis]PTE19609.1 excinuclease ABC subunit C [Cereibacter changlensis JA139]PZX52265.1 GIY-YIG catalytic domain-containing protein [Cereibacter changlensis]
MMQRNPDDTNYPPFETEDLRSNLAAFLATPFDDPVLGRPRAVGSFTWGVYAFFDYDGEPIYVGQTKEKISTRIRRHLTNQRTDAVAMSVLDPFEVFEVEVWPLPQFERTAKKDAGAKAHLDALEHLVYQQAVAGSVFKAILNEKNPPAPVMAVEAPSSLRFRLVSDGVHRIRSHPDFRIARRALILSRLAQVISERKVQGGLRRVLLTQAKRLQWLADRRYTALGGEASVEREESEEE